MKNIKCVAIATDGNMKRIAITYDEVDATGKVTKANTKTNRVVTDAAVLENITKFEQFAQSIVDSE